MAQDLENIIESITNKADHTDFIWDLLLAYGISKTTITKAKKETADLFGGQNQIILKKKVLFERVDCCQNVLNRLDELQKDENSYTKDPRFIIVTDFKDIAAYDTKTKEAPLAIPFKDLYRHSEFFLPWSGREKYEAHLENPADVKAAEKMAKIYDEIYSHNKEFASTNNHALNVFLVRLLFCFFAEDTGIFEGENIFTEAITNHTKDDGSDLNLFFETLYESLDKRDKSGYPSYMQQFPYVNGHLFADKFPIPVLNAKVRHLILECGDQNWKEINPDIFGSMFQAVKDSKVRSGLGQHYTSVPNIMKVINPLFMDDLREEFRNSYNDPKQLKKLQARLSNIRIFDPACGSGNFLIISLKQLKLFEMDVIHRLAELDKNLNMQMNLSVIYLKQFYGIEIDDFACEIARLSLWLSEHQMNCKFKEEFGVTRPTLPLTESGHIVCGNACRLNWEEVCPKTDTKTEIYIPSNPPYKGARYQEDYHKQDLEYVLSYIPKHTKLDYVTIWFIKASKYIEKSNAKFAFVCTNSITQGEQVLILWPYVLGNNLEIFFAYQSFKWSNNAKDKAGVVVVIIGLQTKNSKPKMLYTKDGVITTDYINNYLEPTTQFNIAKQSKSISKFPKLERTNPALDDGHLLLSEYDKDYLVEKYPDAAQIIKPVLGAEEFLYNKKKFCLWIPDDKLDFALNIPEVRDRIEKTKQYREGKTAFGSKDPVAIPHQFLKMKMAKKFGIFVPTVTSEKRVYLPIFDNDTVIIDPNFAIYDPPLIMFGILSSRLHNLWLKKFSGRLGTGYRYSSTLVYNTFPFPKISKEQERKLELYINQLLEVREKYFSKTFADLYDPDKMPKDLAEAHHNLDLCIESCYRKRPFENDDQRLKYLFKMYELMSSGAKDEDLKQLELL